MIYTVTLNPAIDYVVGLDSLNVGQINRSRWESVQFGGKGINVSRVLRNLDVNTVALGFVAGFTGEALEQGLTRCAVATDFVHVEQGLTRINVKLTAQEETQVNGAGPEITSADLQKLYQRLDRVEAGDMLVLSGSVPGCLKPEIYGQILGRLSDKQILTVVDAAGEALRHTLEHEPFLVKPNLQELENFFEISLDTEEKQLNSVMELQKMGAKNVLLSLGGEGAMLLDQYGRSHRRSSPQGKVVNTVGAGDSMVAGFLAGYGQSGSFDHALKLGVAAGSATAFETGLATKEQILDLLHQM